MYEGMNRSIFTKKCMLIETLMKPRVTKEMSNKVRNNWSNGVRSNWL